MPKDNYKGVASGIISIFKITNTNVQQLLTRRNTILANADFLIAEILSGNSAAYLTNIRVYDGVTLKSNGVISSKSTPSDNVVRFQSLFSDVSFDGDFNNCKLGPSDNVTLGDFAESSFTTQNKLNTEQLLITWDILFNVAP